MSNLLINGNCLCVYCVIMCLLETLTRGICSKWFAFLVGNIPYDATEERLIQICEEVGPVVSFSWSCPNLKRVAVKWSDEGVQDKVGYSPAVSFLDSEERERQKVLRRGGDGISKAGTYVRELVTDRETGKPKGYGFCEYKDEETALSARRNLQGYEINGRQLRVDFAENDKNTDRSREKGHGGPGMIAAVDHPKQIGGSAVHGDSGLYQPIGLSVAMAAAAVMAGVLGRAQTGSKSNQNGLQTDPLTLHLATMSKNLLNEIMSEVKAMATENKEQARQLLLVNPTLQKAVFQVVI
ncbi:hypothetical protein RJ639_033164 [Escallonia herrerae]|uniref:RRM domain-containing protein n=1 Tax=Escallonia herrerae TaxID=1293975 RepID=A0AA88WX39_9ASTE|nr:hypothetical protein RJ639_033164 [Escallonia herrerae]